MIRINLLPYRAARKKENIRIQVNIFLGSVFILALLVVWFNAHLNGRIKSLNTEISSTNAQVAKYEKINQEIDEIKKKLALLNRKIEVIESLEAGRKDPVQQLDNIYKLLVEKRMWYTQIEEKGPGFNISGIAIDNQTVADYMTRVEKSDIFQNVTLASVKQQTIQGTELKLKLFSVKFDKSPKNKQAAEGKK